MWAKGWRLLLVALISFQILNVAESDCKMMMTDDLQSCQKMPRHSGAARTRQCLCKKTCVYVSQYCMMDGYWHSNHSCMNSALQLNEIIKRINNLRVKLDFTANGGMIFEYSCSNGNILHGAKVIKCLNGKRSVRDFPFCVSSEKCLPTSIPDDMECVSRKFGWRGETRSCRCRHACANVTLTCQGYDYWSRQQTCKAAAVNRYMEVGLHFRVHISQHANGETHKFSCARGYSLQGKDEVYCVNNILSSEEIPICIKNNDTDTLMSSESEDLTSESTASPNTSTLEQSPEPQEDAAVSGLSLSQQPWFIPSVLGGSGVLAAALLVLATCRRRNRVNHTPL